MDTRPEKDRRRYAAIEAMKLGHGGQNYISSVLGCHFQTVMAGSPIDKEIRWTNLSFKGISKAFESKGMNISPHVVKQLLKNMVL
jgi:hypothetical protein